MAIDYTKYPLPRSRQHVSSNQYLPRHRVLKDVHYYPPLPTSADWNEHFANAQAPQYLDIGCGLGKFLLDTALAEPEVNILGLEVRKYAVEWIQGVIKAEKLSNVTCWWYSVVNGLPFINTHSIERVFYFFPDPWFKRRHIHRRAFTLPFLDELVRVLKPGGLLYLMTDVPIVDEYQRGLLNKHGGFTLTDIQNEQEWGLSLRTNQEEFCLKKNIPYTRLLCHTLSGKS